LARKSGDSETEPPEAQIATQEAADDWGREIVFDALQPDPYLLVSEWADKYRILSNKASGEPGPWRTDRTPYLRDIMDALSPTSPYERVVFMKGAQLGATEAGLNWVVYVIDIAPKPTMIVWPTDQNIKDNSQIRLKPLLEDCPTIAKKISEQHGTRDPANNTFLKEFPWHARTSQD